MKKLNKNKPTQRADLSTKDYVAMRTIRQTQLYYITN